MPDRTKHITIGLEACIQQRPPVLDSARFGLLMNQASVTHDLHHACDVLADAYPGQLTALFSPQHGLWGEAQANMIESPHARHARLGIPIHSLYSETRRPTPEMLDGLDCLVVDLQDVGTRVYTFIWTVQQCLVACAEAGVPVVILDRPNPLGGRLVEGAWLEPDFRSFVGGACIPMRHGLTIGELALLINDELDINVSLDVVPMHRWQRDDLFDTLDRAWIAPSLNLRRFEAALTYPGQVLLEGTNLSEGRGTTQPFEAVGAPFLDPEELCVTANNLALPGVRFLPTRFRPTFDKWHGESCGGVSLHVTDAEAFRPYRTTLALLAAIRESHPAEFTWLDPPYEYETLKPPIDIISGSATLRETLDRTETLGGALLDELSDACEAEWWGRARNYLLY